MKNKITIKTTYIGEDKEHIKNSDPIRIFFIKKELLMEYFNYNIPRQCNNVEEISLLSYVRQKIQKIRQSGSVYY